MPDLWIPIEPHPKERPRRGKNGGFYTPAATTKVEKAIRQAWLDAEKPNLGDHNIFASLDVYLDGFYVTLAKSPNRNPFRGDIDNYEKIVWDGLAGAAYKNDSQIVQTLTTLIDREHG